MFIFEVFFNIRRTLDPFGKTCSFVQPAWQADMKEVWPS